MIAMENLDQFIDSHQHFWQYDPVRESWIDDEMHEIRKDFLPQDLQPLFAQNNVTGCVAVQSDQSEAHNQFLLKLSEVNSFIKGIVGWVDLQSTAITDRLEYYSQFKIVKGFRHVLQGEADRALMLKPAFMQGIKALQNFTFTYDILIFPDQLTHVCNFVKAFPNQKFVIDHLAKPYIKAGKIEDWKRDIMQVAKHENVWCKLSGMVTEADYKTWTSDQLTPYIDVAVQAFGTKRLMFGSDWPVCLVAATYAQVLENIKSYFASFSGHERQQVFKDNAIEFYNL